MNSQILNLLQQFPKVVSFLKCKIKKYNFLKVLPRTTVNSIMNQDFKDSGGKLGIIQTKMEVGIQFWAPNLGLSPKYD